MKLFALRSLCSLRLNRRMDHNSAVRSQESESSNPPTATATARQASLNQQPATSNPQRAARGLPQLARVVADGKLRRDLRQQRNKLARAGDAEAAAAIDALLNDAKAARGGDEIPFTVMISPNLFHGLQKLKSWGKHDSLPGMAEDILADSVRAELRARMAKGYDVPQRLVESFLVDS